MLRSLAQRAAAAAEVKDFNGTDLANSLWGMAKLRCAEQEAEALGGYLIVLLCDPDHEATAACGAVEC